MHEQIESSIWECLEQSLTMKRNGEIQGVRHAMPGALESFLRRFYPSPELNQKLKALKGQYSLSINPHNTEQMQTKQIKLKPEDFGKPPRKFVQENPCCGQEAKATSEAAASPTSEATPKVVPVELPDGNQPTPPEVVALIGKTAEEVKDHFGSIKEVKAFAAEFLGLEFQPQDRGNKVLPEVVAAIELFTSTSEEEE